MLYLAEDDCLQFGFYGEAEVSTKHMLLGRVLRTKVASNGEAFAELRGRMYLGDTNFHRYCVEQHAVCTGSVGPDTEVFCDQNPVLARPCGICFCDAGYLFVTSMLGKARICRPVGQNR